MTDLADKVKQAQSAFGAASPQPVAGSPCPAAQMLKPATPPPVAPAPVSSVVAVAPAPAKQQEKPIEKHWIEIILVDMEGNPMPGVKYRITPPGGAPVEGTLNQYGQAGVYQIDPGNCKITFPDLDQDAWA